MSVKTGSLFLFVVLFLGSASLTVSQNTSFSSDEPSWFNETRPIEYRRLNEVNKYIRYKITADTVIFYLKEQVRDKDSVIFRLEQNKLSFEREIESYKHGEQLFTQELANVRKIMGIKDEDHEREIKEERKKKWNWGTVGALLGSIIGILIGIQI